MNSMQAKKLASISSNKASSPAAKIVQKALINAGLETPMQSNSKISNDEKYQKIKRLMKTMRAL